MEKRFSTINGRQARLQSKTMIKAKRAWQLYLLLLLPVLYILIFNYFTMAGVILAFKRYTPAGGIFGSEWVGLYQFNKLFSSYKFLSILKNTITLSVYNVFAPFPVAIIFALLLNATINMKLKKTVQMVTYMPHFISVVVMVGVLTQLLNTRIGLYGRVMDMLGLEAVDLLSDPAAFKHLYVWSGAWQNVGWGSILFLSVLSSVDPELHEAAIVDGASRFKRVLYIDIPTIIPTIAVVTILKCGQIMSLGFDKVFLLQNSLNLSSSEIIATYSYKVGFVTGGGDFSYSTAIGLFNSVINMLLFVGCNQLSKKAAGTSLF